MRKEKREEMKRKRKKIILIICTIIVFIFITIVIILNIRKEVSSQARLGKLNLLSAEIEEEETIQTFSSNIETNKDGDFDTGKKGPEINSKTTDWNLILVNKDNPIPNDYKFEKKTIEYGNKVDSRIAENLTQMLNDARDAGLNPWICSSYRTNNTQKKLYNQKVNKYKREGYSKQEAEEKASYWVAIPNTSEHEIGLAVDIVSKTYQILDEKQEETEVQKWLIENCYKYGFILRYPTDKKEITKINYEPWHYRYVGVENAKFMKDNDYCLEEYIEYLENVNQEIVQL